jgi:hypothetical protein
VIPEIIRQLERQQTAINQAINALRGIDTDQPQAVKRGRPPKEHPPATVAATAAPKAKKPRFRHYTDEFRRQVVADARQTSIGDAARKHGVTWYSVRTWLDSGKFGLKAKAAGQ